MIQSDSLLEYVDEIATSAPLGVVCILVVGLGRFEDLIRGTSFRGLQPWKSRQHLVRHATVTGPGGGPILTWESQRSIARSLYGDGMEIVLFRMYSMIFECAERRGFSDR